MNVLYVHIFCYVYYCSNVKLCVHQNCKKKYFLLSDIQEKRKLWVFYTWIYFYSVSLRPFSAFLAELSKNKVCHYYICLNFLLTSKFLALLWVSARSLLVCGWAGSDQRELLRVGSFQGLSPGTCWWPPWCDFLCPGGYLQFQKVHESILLTRTCLVCSSVKKKFRIKK